MLKPNGDLSMASSPPTLSSGAASSGVAGAAVVILQWAMGLFHVPLPADVGAAILVILAPLIHWAITRAGLPDAPPATVPETKP